MGAIILLCKWIMRQKKKLANQSSNAFVPEEHSTESEELSILRTVAQLCQATWTRLTARFSFPSKICQRSEDMEKLTSSKSLLFFHCPPSISALNTNRCNCLSDNASCDRMGCPWLHDRYAQADYQCSESPTSALASPVNPDALMKRYRAILQNIRKSNCQVHDKVGKVNPNFEMDHSIERLANSDRNRDKNVFFETVVPARSFGQSCCNTTHGHRKPECQRSVRSEEKYETNMSAQSPDTWTARPIPGIRSHSLSVLRNPMDREASRLKRQSSYLPECLYSDYIIPSVSSACVTSISNSGSFIPCLSDTTMESDKSERFLISKRAVMVLRANDCLTDKLTVCGQGDNPDQPVTTNMRFCSRSTSVSPLDEQSETVLSQNTSVSLSLPPTSVQWTGDIVPNKTT